MPPLILTDELLLLAYRPDTGRPVADSNRLQCGLAGALIAELVVAGHTVPANDRLHAAGRSVPTGDPDLDGLVEQIAAERPRKAEWWVRKLNRDALRRRLLDRAVADGALVHEHGRIMGVFPANNYRPAQPGAREDTVNRLRWVLEGHHPPDARTAALIALVAAVGLDKNLFPDIPGSRRRRMIKAVAQRDDISEAVRSVIRSVETVTVAVIAAGAAAGGSGGAS